MDPSPPSTASQAGPAAPRGDVGVPTWAVIAGGGTAGHVLPALAIARALVARGRPREAIHFVGAERGIEGRLVPEAGFGLTVLPGRGVARRLTLQNVGALAGLAVAGVRAVRLLARLRPAVVISVGGYASVPCVAAACVLRIPLVVAEQNAVPGAANRLAARLARATAVSFEGTPLPRAVVTGNPVRAEIVAVDRGPAGRTAARRALGLPLDRAVVAGFGGSLGARRINDALTGLAASWAERDDLAIRHIVGERDWDAVVGARPDLPTDGLVYQQVRYEERMDAVFAAADVVVCRAGASTVAEVAVVGLPAVLIPLPGAPGDHQGANARALAAAGAAVVVPDAEVTPERLAAELDRILSDEPLRARMEGAGRQFAHPDAADAVARLAEEHARG